MNKSKDNKLTGISKADTVEEIAEFWDSHSLADYWDQGREVEFEVRAEHRRRITLDPEIYGRVEFQARTRGISPETLINLWVVEKLQEERLSRKINKVD
jgi:hypothetical protein